MLYYLKTKIKRVFMKKKEILHFQHMNIENAYLIKNPLKEAKKHTTEKTNIVFFRNPYDYFDTMLSAYLQTGKSLLFTQKIIEQMKVLEGDTFLEWLDTLNFIPLYNPQTFFMDVCKRVTQAMDNLENFDYVIPYEESHLVGEISQDLIIKKKEHTKLSFSIKNHKEHPLVEKFLAKDLELYRKTLELWNLSKENTFQPLGNIIKRKIIYTPLHKAIGFHGRCGGMNIKMIRGFAFYQDAQKPLTLEIYKNDKLLTTTIADIIRPDVQQQFKLDKETCGFQVNFKEETLTKGDKVQIIIVPDNIELPIVGNAKAFLE
jgi:hypothetical protein